ncbi:MAG: aspartate/glutamate racemase family protein, partial [Blastocatellia bacterium]
RGETKLAGVIEAAIRVTVRMHPNRLAIIGGRRTVLSGVYRRAFAERSIAVRQRIAQPLSGLIENGDTHSSRLREECRKILLPIRTCSHVLLACTHYPAILSELRHFVSTGTTIIDPSDEIVNQIAHWRLPAGGKQTFLSSGDTEKMKHAAFNAFGVRLAKITRVDI